jgi:hypothetical protein
MAYSEALFLLKESIVELNLGRNPIHILVFIAEITDELILGLILHAYDAFMDLGALAIKSCGG